MIKIIVDWILHILRELWSRVKADIKIEEAKEEYNEAKKTADKLEEDSSAAYDDFMSKYEQYKRNRANRKL